MLDDLKTSGEFSEVRDLQMSILQEWKLCKNCRESKEATK
jgi:hypothetical protein